VTGPTGYTGGGVTGHTGFTGLGVTGPTGPGGGGGGGIITYYEDSGSTITPSINTSIRVIAGAYYDNIVPHPRPPPNVALTMPTPTASNDYLNVEFQYSSNSVYPGVYLQVTFPSACNFLQPVNSQTNYVWDSNASSTWSVISYYAASTTFCN
jgi:hypothetical protein